MARIARADTPAFDLRRFLPPRVAEILGTSGAASFRPQRARVVEAAAHAASARRLSDDELRAQASGSDTARLLALIAEAAGRAFGHPPYDEQLLAVAALVDGLAVEMDTGEGKTLVGAMAAASHALAGRRVHVLSVNDYLARRDAEWMAPLFEILGLDVAWLGQASSAAERRAAYRASVVYAPVSEIGYDVLRDRQVITQGERVAPEFDVAVVDEADAVMIDEAMTPLVLAGTGPDAAEDLIAATELVAGLTRGIHYAVDEDGATVSLTDAGLDAIESRLGGVNLFDLEHSSSLTRINLALHARALVHRDVDYLVADGRIRLVNTARGRIAELQRWPDGLHAAVEAKEGLEVTPPGVILDTITVQDLLLRYRTLSGMSGTILAVAEELAEFYRLGSGRVERHRPGVRVDEPLRVLATPEERTAAVVAEIARRHDEGQPVLVGTQSIAESEALAGLLPVRMRARVLNARNDEQEAALVARAGEFGAVTISTQMSGRGTDIRLGGADEGDRERVVAAGGLVVIATALYPSRRLDQQLRGRAGRQGDPGASVSFASVRDDLVLQNATRRSLERIERGGLDARARVKVAREAQRIAETVRLGRHRGTWEYNRAIAAQREKVLAVRGRVLAGEQRDRLRELAADRGRALLRDAGEDAVDRAVRLLALYHLDDGWQEHLALLTEVRDGIHLRVLAGQNPAEEFHRIALREFDGFFERVDAATADDVRRLSADDLDDPLGGLGRRRPSATWTYMVRDDPFGAAGGRAGRLRDAILGRREG
ncbi:accessory Sec system translocase SecA2 [Microbacterium sp. SORGH_AS_0888]|uniref:accessory Sec system translocase SecA2 n=1 Tax=Microbacterium sp. SORGH_AS_0888 TaxID=3041791 RepID=UPI00278B2BF7|nr:accessory Sec system translocase SecA2 [Microbacterium sp. SORGH_AS_0888]MDQ1128605.1 preprotein translocase subunit SecA [Microbacterium sp. SORGH_AS_0888]